MSAPVSTLCAVTLAPEIAAPVESTIVPSIVPDPPIWACAIKGVAMNAINIDSAIQMREENETRGDDPVDPERRFRAKYLIPASKKKN